MHIMNFMDAKEQTRQKILVAAQERFERYGFNKTTMNEIAKDCEMSAANIYRFFKNKGELIAEKLDIIALLGRNRAGEARKSVRVVDGLLSIRFEAVNNNATVCAFVVMKGE